MRRSAKVLLSAGGVLVLTAAGLAWLVATPSGQQMLLRTALPLVPGLKAGSIEGGFFDLTITDLSYEMPGLTAGADRITLRLDRDALLSERRIAVTKLEILHPHGVLDSASLPSSDPSAPSADTGPVTMPWPVSLDNAEITSLDFTADGTKVTLAYFGASASWIGEALSVKPLRIRSLAVALPGSEKTAEERAEEDRKVAERRAAEIKAKFEARKPVITFDATELNKMFADLFSKPLLTELPEVSLPFSLDVSEFEATNLKLAGASPVVIDELRLDASMKASEVEIRRLDLKMPEATGSLKGRARLSGKWPLDLRANTRLSVAPVRGEKADVTLVGEVMGKVSLAAVAEGPVPAKFLLGMAAGLESQSQDPLARAVMRKAAAENIKLSAVKDVTILDGQGLTGKMAGKVMAGGSAEFIATQCELTPDLQQAGEQLTADGIAPLYFSLDGHAAGLIGVADAVKPASKAAIDALKALGLDVILLTGDSRTNADRVAAQVGLDDAHVVSGLAPAELEAELRRLQTNGPAAMIGSTSAAAALACADVGIGMGAEPLPAADVMLLRDDLADAAAAVRISRAVDARIAQNTRMALVYSALLPLLAAGVLYPLNFVLHPIDSVILMTLFVAWLLSGTARLNSFDPKPASQSEPQKEPAE